MRIICKCRTVSVGFAVIISIATASPTRAQDCNSNGTDDATDILLGTSADGDGNGIPDECQVTINQLNYVDGDDLFLANGENSHVGDVNFSFVAGPDVLWGQVVVDGNWVVRNLPLFSIDGVGVDHRYSTQFYLGNVPGNSVSFASVHAQITPAQMNDQGPAPVGSTLTIPVTPETHGQGGHNAPGDGDWNPNLAAIPGNFTISLFGFTWEITTRPNMPNLNVQWNHCSPGAAANSFKCITDRLCIPIDQTHQQMYDKLRNGTHMMTTKADGTDFAPIANNKEIAGMQAFINGKDLAPFLSLVSSGTHYNGVAFNPALVHQWMQEGKDVFMAYGYTDAAGGGHSVVVAGTIKCGDNICVIVRSDHAQDRRNQAARPGGIDKFDVHCFQSLAGGNWQLTNERPNVIDGAIGVCATQPMAWDYVWSSDPVDWSPGLWTKNGEVIGTTNPGPTGGILPPHASDHVDLPVWPNDWHWDAQFDWLGLPSTIQVWFENFDANDDLSLEIYCTTDPPDYMITVDVGNNQYTLMDPEGFPFHFGQWSQYPLDLPPNFSPTGSVRMNTQPNTPENDECEGAIGLACGDTISGSTLDATFGGIEAGLPACGTSIGGAGVWYTFVGDGTNAVVSTCNPGTDYDTKLHVWESDGTCDNLICAAGNDDACGLQSEVAVPTNPGTVYYVFVNGFSGATGNFELSLNCLAPTGACCLTCGECIETDAFDCVSLAGSYAGDFTDCFTGCPGPDPTGACCLPDSGCVITCAPDCVAQGGAYSGDGVSCQPTGGFGGTNTAGDWVMTVSDNAAGDTTQWSGWALSINGGAIVGNSVRPDPSVPDADPTGISDAISLPDTTTVSDIEITVGLSSTWIGDVNVELTAPDGTTVTVLGRPGVIGGAGAGDSSDLGDGIGGTADYTFSDAGSTDMPTEASGLGADDVLSTDVVYRATDGEDQIVNLNEPSTSPCEPPPGGACCLRGLLGCVDVTGELGCEIREGLFQGEGSLCDAAQCGCPCDFSLPLDGIVDVNDLLAFLASWFPDQQNNPPPFPGMRSDYNGDGIYDSLDLLAYLGCWFPASEPGGTCR